MFKYRNFRYRVDDPPAGGGGVPPSPAPAPEKEPPGPVPYERFAEVIAKQRAAEAKLAELEAARKASEEATLTEQKRWQELAEKREAELKQERTTRLRLQIAAAKGLSPALAERLRGDTESELNADADALLALIPAPTAPAPEKKPGVPPPTRGGSTKLSLAGMTPEEIRKRTSEILRQ